MKLMFNKALNLEAMVKEPDIEGMKALDFVSRRGEKSIPDWPDGCAQVFYGSKRKFVKCITQKDDLEGFVSIGFVLKYERLPNDDSANNSKPRTSAA
jgi:hypothetical protein